jgi:hypothetical protein
MIVIKIDPKYYATLTGALSTAINRWEDCRAECANAFGEASPIAKQFQAQIDEAMSLMSICDDAVPL